MPSLRYSELGSLLALTKGMTATEVIWSGLLRLRQSRQRPPPEQRDNASDCPEQALAFCSLGRQRCAAAISTRAELESRRKRFRSASISAALW